MSKIRNSRSAYNRKRLLLLSFCLSVSIVTVACSPAALVAAFGNRKQPSVAPTADTASTNIASTKKKNIINGLQGLSTMSQKVDAVVAGKKKVDQNITQIYNTINNYKSALNKGDIDALFQQGKEYQSLMAGLKSSLAKVENDLDIVKNARQSVVQNYEMITNNSTSNNTTNNISNNTTNQNTTNNTIDNTTNNNVTNNNTTNNVTNNNSTTNNNVTNITADKPTLAVSPELLAALTAIAEGPFGKNPHLLTEDILAALKKDTANIPSLNIAPLPPVVNNTPPPLSAEAVAAIAAEIVAKDREKSQAELTASLTQVIESMVSKLGLDAKLESIVQQSQKDMATLKTELLAAQVTPPPDRSAEYFAQLASVSQELKDLKAQVQKLAEQQANVKPAEVPPVWDFVLPDKIELDAGSSITLYLKTTGTDPSKDLSTWETTDPSIVEIQGTGTQIKLVGKKAGTAFIKVKLGLVSQIATVIVGGVVATASPSPSPTAVAVPTITSLNPAGGGKAGSTLTISGTGFDAIPGNNIVKFGDVTATVTEATPTSLKVTIPTVKLSFPHPPTGVTNITLTVGGKIYTLTNQYLVDLSGPAPVLTSLSPNSGSIGSTLTISGTGFDATPGNNIVQFGNITAMVKSATPTSLTVTVPQLTPDGSPRNVTVTVGGQTNTGINYYTLISPTASASPSASPAPAPYTVSTFAGSSSGSADGTVTAAKFSSPSGMTIDSAGNLYVADTYNNCIRKITPTGIVSTFAGSDFVGTGQGYADGPKNTARFREPRGITIDSAGDLYVADTGNNCIRKITSGGAVSTIAGSSSGYSDGTVTAAKFWSPSDITIDSVGNLYVVDSGNNRIRKLTPL